MRIIYPVAFPPSVSFRGKSSSPMKAQDPRPGLPLQHSQHASKRPQERSVADQYDSGMRTTYPIASSLIVSSCGTPLRLSKSSDPASKLSLQPPHHASTSKTEEIVPLQHPDIQARSRVASSEYFSLLLTAFAPSSTSTVQSVDNPEPSWSSISTLPQCINQLASAHRTIFAAAEALRETTSMCRRYQFQFE